MSSFFNRMRSTATTSNTFSTSSLSKKDSNAQQITPLERHLLDAGPVREDGSDKFWGLENFGNTCYCNSILQCLYYSVPFREQVINYPKMTPTNAVVSNSTGQKRLNVDAAILPANHSSLSYAKLMNRQNAPNPSARNPGGPPVNAKPEDKEHPDFKKRLAHARGPVIAMNYENAAAYGMPESLFTSLKDIFEALYAHRSRVGVVSPSRFLEVLRREHEMFRTAMHQDAHEFLNLLLNEVVTSVEENTKKLEEEKGSHSRANGSANGSVDKTEFEHALANSMPKPHVNNKMSVHELFEGTLTSETKCLTCENVSQRDEAFLDLSVDLEDHASVTSCLRKFSEEEMLCERNKFHCDRCGGLQEAEKRMKIKRLPRILALHLKRFKYTEDLQRLQKLFHRVVYPYHLRLFNTTDDAEDPDRLYELYAVVVHIGGGPYHGHYVSIIKTEDQGWLLFDDEMVEPVDKSYVQNFFGDRPGLACAYVLFYQETTIEAVQREQHTPNVTKIAKTAVDEPKDPVGLGLKANGFLNGMHHVKSVGIPTSEDEGTEILDRAISDPELSTSAGKIAGEVTALPQMPSSSAVVAGDVKSKKEKVREEKDRKSAAREAAKEEEKAERTRRKTLEIKRKEMVKKAEAQTKTTGEAERASKTEEDPRGVDPENANGVVPVMASGSLGRFKSTSKSFRRPKFFGNTTKDNREETMPNIDQNAGPIGNPGAEMAESAPAVKSKSPFSSLRKKTSAMIL